MKRNHITGGMQECRVCHIDLPVDEFEKDTCYESGRSNRCRVCASLSAARSNAKRAGRRSMKRVDAPVVTPAPSVHHSGCRCDCGEPVNNVPEYLIGVIPVKCHKCSTRNDAKETDPEAYKAMRDAALSVKSKSIHSTKVLRQITEGQTGSVTYVTGGR
jgi:CRISPR/Cas system-associated protein Cas10 (large subunit of type III CRISPR-Cas system)